MSKEPPALNQMFRDKYPGQELRTVRVIELLPNGVTALVVTDATGVAPKRERQTSIMFKTLRSGYIPISEDQAMSNDITPAVPAVQQTAPSVCPECGAYLGVQPPQVTAWACDGCGASGDRSDTE